MVESNSSVRAHAYSDFKSIDMSVSMQLVFEEVHDNRFWARGV